MTRTSGTGGQRPLHHAIYAVRNDRLGGRLGAMLNAKRLADEYDLAFRFTWASHDSVSPELQNPEALFSQRFLDEYREEDLSFGELQQNAQAIEALPHGASIEWVAEQLKERRLRCSEALRVVVLPWENAEEAAEKVAQTLDRIEFHPDVRAAMDKIRARLGDGALTAYHLRRGDIIDPAARPSNVLWPTKYIPTVYYEEHISRVLNEDPDARIVIFSDAQHEVDAFCALSERVIPASDLIPTEGLDPLQRDFLELFTMSRCKRIVAPGASNFSTVAAILGNSQIVPVVNDLTPPELQSAMARLSHQLDQEPERFAGDADLGQNFPTLIAYHRARRSPDESLRILKKHYDRGFKQSYIYDLLAEEYFRGGDSEGSIALAESLRNRPILTDLANAHVYAWAGLAALVDGRKGKAARFAHSANWLQPNLPLARILLSALHYYGIDRNNHYPIVPELLLFRDQAMPRFAEVAKRLPPMKKPDGTPALMAFLPFELDLRDWNEIQSIRLPAPFWNVPNQTKMLGFFNSTYRHVIDAPGVRSLLGQLHIQAKDHETGVRLIEHAQAESPDDPLVVIRHARLLWDRGEHDRALRRFDKAAELSKDQTCFLAEWGAAFMRAGRKDEAVTIFADLAGRSHDMIEVMILTADILRRTKNTREQALTVIEHADKLVPGAVRTTQLHRKVLEQLGRKGKAKEIEKRLLDWNRRPGKFSSRIKSIN